MVVEPAGDHLRAARAGHAGWGEEGLNLNDCRQDAVLVKQAAKLLVVDDISERKDESLVSTVASDCDTRCAPAANLLGPPVVRLDALEVANIRVAGEPVHVAVVELACLCGHALVALLLVVALLPIRAAKASLCCVRAPAERHHLSL
ncbi:nonstructural protein 2 [Penaeus monodon circovirus VN11]|uniref:nonstructural protein 2 n=1 Tax=Penaeus monodon circovirus VN11 TaxID=1419711 RepID=UPI0003C76877|nr:nonstructural protein 2 [Penaeus monodon circovirus VN11]AHA36870.1 nonstructural protein 2 [Penaeus monodon circovirus VN11]